MKKEKEKEKEKEGGSHEWGQSTFPPHQLINIIDKNITQPYKNASFLHQKYVLEELTIKELAAEIGCSESTVSKYLDEFDIPVRASTDKNSSRLAYGEAWRQDDVTSHKRELAIITKIKRLREQGMSYWKIAAHLNETGVPTKTRKGKWHARYVKLLCDRS